MREGTIVYTMPLPAGRDWEWFDDCNVVALAPHLDEDGRDRALSEVQVHWRRSCLRVVPKPEGSQRETQPPASAASAVGSMWP